MAFSDEWNIIDKCEHGVQFGLYCPRCWRWEKERREEANRLRDEREKSQSRTSTGQS